MALSVLDVAAYILKKSGSMTTMKLQKLCYYSQGWSLAWDEVPLFDEEIQAWANGPVVYRLYDRHRGSFRVSSIQGGDASKVKGEARATVDAVLEGYGGLTGQQLSDKTHQEPPWRIARKDLPAGAISDRAIDLGVMQDYFGGLDSAG